MREGEGARAPNDRHPNPKYRRPFGARVGVSPRRGCWHSRNGPWVPPTHPLRGPTSLWTRGCCARVTSSAAARRASVHGVATHAQPRTAAPASEESYFLATMLRTEQHRLNRAPPLAPLQTLSCCVPLSGKAAGSMGAAAYVGISLLRSACAVRPQPSAAHPSCSRRRASRSASASAFGDLRRHAAASAKPLLSQPRRK